MAPLPLSKFLAAWAPVALVSASVDPAPRLADLFAFSLGGVIVPPITCALGAIGVLAARPLARRAESALSWPLFILVSLIMLIVVQLWIVDSRPGALFAFVIAIGLGFSGYSLIELIGTQVADFVKRIVSIPTGKLRDSAPGESPEDPKA